MKNKIIAGNWKMNKNRVEAEALITELIPLVADTKNTVIICVPFTDLCTAVKLTKGTNIHVGAQNCHWKESGAYTGEIAPVMLAELGVDCVAWTSLRCDSVLVVRGRNGMWQGRARYGVSACRVQIPRG